MKKQINPPANWQDFEELCHKLWRDIWGDINTQKNGRQGQQQSGVDIYGQSFLDKGYCGVQCKGKNENYGSKLTIDELDNESSNATKFKPELKNFTIATTSPRDKSLQERARIITEKKEIPFPVNVWSWDDISDELQYRPEVYSLIYNEEIECDNQKEIHISCFNKSDRLCAFLTRPFIRKHLSTLDLQLIGATLSELIDNAFRHGYASEVKIVFSDIATFKIIDNGTEYDSISNLLNNGNGGHVAVNRLFEVYNRGLSHEYNYENGQNITTLVFDPSILKQNFTCLEIEFPRSDNHFVISKDDAIKYANVDIADIRKHGKAKLLIKSYGAPSGCIAYLHQIGQSIPNSIESVSLPSDSSGFYETILDNYNIKYTKR